MKRASIVTGIASSALSLTLIILSLHALPTANAQKYNRDWEYHVVGGVSQRRWRPTANDPWMIFDRLEVVEITSPNVLTYWLEYNCYYMPSICKNALEYVVSAANVGRVATDISLFAYDFNTKRSDYRRKTESCPSNWIDKHRCPEGNQVKSYRYVAEIPAKRAKAGKPATPEIPGYGDFWDNIGLEPGSQRVLASRLDAQGNLEESRIHYTCDEWPPATFHREHGEESGFKSEQDFQGIAHKMLAGMLKDAIEVSLRQSGVIFHPDQHVGVVGFRTILEANGFPAKVVTIDANGVETKYDSFFKRDLQGGTAPPTNLSRSELRKWVASSLDLEHARVHFKEALKEYPVYLNGTTGFRQNVPMMPQWDTGFEDLGVASGFNGLAPAASRYFHGTATPGVATGNTTVDNPESGPHRRPHAKEVVNPRTRAMALHRRLQLAVNGTDASTTPLLKSATLSELEKAVRVVEAALAESAKRNAARLANPARNHYGLAPGTIVNGRRKLRRRDADTEAPPPLLKITPEIAAAAALVAEADAVEFAGGSWNLNATKPAAPVARRAGTFWMENIARKGTVPWGDDPSYKVFRNVRDYGAKGDGITDDTAAIVEALENGRRCGKRCNGSTLKNAIVYFPPGTYLVAFSLALPYGTQVIGDANNWPTLKAARRFVGLGVLSTDEYTGGGDGIDGLAQEYYINTANFYRQIRNLRIDITDVRDVKDSETACIHYQVAQATSLQFVELIAKSGTTQRGIFAENGSGGSISDVTFKGGKFGLYGGNQQFTAQRLTFDGCDTAVQIFWDWGWIWKSVTVKNVGVGFRLLRENKADSDTSQKVKGQANIGSASFIDSSFSGVQTAVLIAPVNSKPGTGSTGVMLENVRFDNVGKAVADTSGKTLLDGGSKRVESWATGPIYSPTRQFSSGSDSPKYKREISLLDTKGGVEGAPYFERPKPQYEGNSASDFVHLKDLGAKGDGVTDDTSAVQAALNTNVGKLLFIDAGVYILTNTVTVPKGSRIVGELWSQFAARGPYFSDTSNPKVMLKVGSAGDVGTIEMQDLLFTTQGATAGAILVEWNIKAESPGAAGLWECHVRIGGATGTQLNPAECPPVTSGVNSNCNAASLMMHITPKASGYFENMWLWVADHLIDDPDLVDANNTMTQTSVYVARGLLIESQSATWLYSTSSEHSVLYQYNFHKARNIFAGMIQTESPYYQPTPKPPAPFAADVGRFYGDPDYSCKGTDFDGCDSSWAVLIRGSRNIFIAGAGLYSWFSTYTQDCIDKHECQKALLLLQDNGGNIRIQNLITIGAKYSWVQDGKGTLAADNLNVDSHPRWSQITILDLKGHLIDHISPEMATVIPLPHTSVPAKATLTLSRPVASDIVPLPFDGDQNAPEGPGRGHIGNPILIPAGTATPKAIELPIGFVPNQPITGEDGVTYPADKALQGEVVIPQGTVFSEPFLIPGGQPLRTGEDGDDAREGDMIWIDPRIWDESNPVVVCSDFPCTLQFPPWLSATSTLDYPLVTVTSGSTWSTTITRRPITITEWVFEPITVTPPPGWNPTPIGSLSSSTSSSSSTTVLFVIIPIPPFRRTPTWPPVTYTGPDNKPTPTRPPNPPPPPPRNNPDPDPTSDGRTPVPPPFGRWPTLPGIIIRPGPTPTPTVRPCAFPAFQCPGNNPDPDGPGGSAEDPDNEDEDEDPEDPSFCLALVRSDDPEPAVPGGTMSTQPVASKQPSPTPRPSQKPKPKPNKADSGQNERSCYNTGQWTTNDRLRFAAQSFCKELSGGVLGPKSFVERTHNPDFTRSDGASIEIITSVEVMDGCEWESNYDECLRYMKVGIDSCDCRGENNKHGGMVWNNCLKFRIDPGWIL
ncbi:pectate lyase superfamily protein-domain-containing protein [Schizothecium vesticola]|uniref:Pectate lyase superfamily protein-domain-containing protein n=1 Tax=Schizothecium vesticola TaxID=314040 RepID=A0AA40EWE0_9PEZI|nr:pectate lyase superfamily protein-domain-containing protein [Schizothecium vesticola]